MWFWTVSTARLQDIRYQQRSFTGQSSLTRDECHDTGRT